MIPVFCNFKTPSDLMEDLFTTDKLDQNYFNGSYSKPKVNIIEQENDFLIKIAAPGLTREDFKIDLKNNVLTVQSEKNTEEENQSGKYQIREFLFGSFKRSFGLPVWVESEHISATYNNGILTVTIPKKEEAKVKPPRQIEIS